MRETAAPWRRLARSMLAGALYDLGFASAILLIPGTAAGWLGLKLPADPVYLQLNGVLLVLLGAAYLLPAGDPRRYEGVIHVAIGGRFLGFLYFLKVFWSGGVGTFLLLGLGDLAFSLLHAVLWLSARKTTQVHESQGT